MKKIFIMGAAALAFVAFNLTACGNKEKSDDNAQAAVEETAVAEEVDTVALFNQLTAPDSIQRTSEFHTTPSGIKYRIVKEGDGATPEATSTVLVNYEGRLKTGQIFDSSYERGEPISFPLNGVIPGWTEGVQLMKEGSIYEFYIPYNLAYGERGAPPTIPPYANLLFKVELIKVEK